MMKVTGVATLRVPYSVKLDMTAEEFGNLSERKQDELLDEAIDWMDATRSAEVDEIEVFDYED